MRFLSKLQKIVIPLLTLILMILFGKKKQIILVARIMKKMHGIQIKILNGMFILKKIGIITKTLDRKKK